MCACLVLVEASRGRWSYGWLSAAQRVLRMELRSSVRTANAVAEPSLQPHDLCFN